MIITEIKRDKKHLTKICFSGGEEILLDNDVCDENALYEDLEITDEQLKELKHISDYKRAKSRALWYLDRMDYTEKALFEKLLKAGFSKKVSSEVLAKLCEFGLVDDRRYAERFAERCKDSNISKREATAKLLQKGVSYDLVKEILQDAENNEEEQILALLQGKYAYKLTAERGFEKVYAALVRKGFSYSAVRQAMKKYNSDLEFEEQ